MANFSATRMKEVMGFCKTIIRFTLFVFGQLQHPILKSKSLLQSFKEHSDQIRALAKCTGISFFFFFVSLPFADVFFLYLLLSRPN
jgi:hypothetical protein